MKQVKKMDKQAERTAAESKSVERFFKRYETLLKDYSRKPDEREQKIEEQIEEYKRKREKILGDQSAMILSLNETRKELLRESSSFISSFSKIDDISKEDEVIGKEANEEEKIEEDVNAEKIKIKTPKLELEETVAKKESLRKESVPSCKEAELEKLARILGEDNKNLQVTIK